MSDRIIDAITAEPWLITESGMQQVLAVAERQTDLDAFRAKLGGDPDRYKPKSERRGSTAVIPLRGPIVRYANLFSNVSGATSLDVLRTEFQAAANDSAVSRIVLDVDSPGGQSNGIAEFAEMVHAVDKPVVAHIGGMGASAAYWIASAADQVVVSSTGMAGSIGVVATYRPDKSGDYKIVSSQSPLKMITPETEAGLAEWQRIVDDLAAVFVTNVASYRGVAERAVVSSFGRGGLMIGAKAVAAGMADSVGSLESVINGQFELPQRAKLDPKAEFFEMVAAYQLDGMRLSEAVRAIVVNHPDLHSAYLSYVNGG